MSNHQQSLGSIGHRIAQTIRWLSVPIVLFRLAVAAISNAVVPQLEVVGAAHNVALSPADAPSLEAFKPPSRSAISAFSVRSAPRSRWACCSTR
jgi:RND superfamily putative drug exporter